MYGSYRVALPSFNACQCDCHIPQKSADLLPKSCVACTCGSKTPREWGRAMSCKCLDREGNPRDQCLGICKTTDVILKQASVVATNLEDKILTLLNDKFDNLETIINDNYQKGFTKGFEMARKIAEEEGY